MTHENSNQDVAIVKYSYVIEHAKSIQHLPLLVPAFLGIAQLLVRMERWAEALKFIEQFEARFPSRRFDSHFPSPRQRELMRMMKVQILKDQLMKLSA